MARRYVGLLILFVAIVLIGPFDLGLLAQEAISPLLITTPTAFPTMAPTPPPVTPTPRAGIYSHSPETRIYEVKPDDTLLSVALEVGVDLEDAYCLIRPNFSWAQPLVIGDLLSVPAPGTICHEVVETDTLESIALQHGRAPGELVDERWNGLPRDAAVDFGLIPGHHLRIPPRVGTEAADIDDGEMGEVTAVLPLLLSQEVNADIASVMAVGAVFSKGEAPSVGNPDVPLMAPVPADWPYGSGQFGWPMAGWLTQSYKSDHRAIDVAAPAGTVVTAADRGVVIRAGWNNQGYGRFVIVDHRIDYITLYAHLSEVLVEEGEVVAAGQVIGRVGSTGNSTGPHLHFEIRDFGRRIDPLQHLLR